MRLLIITQAVDLDNPVLGFFHRWIEEFSKHAGRVEVIALAVGRHALPPNVSVHSLGKPSSTEATEGLSARLRYICRFFSLLWRLRGAYDLVFVHMNQEYVLLGGWLWRLTGKKVYFWRNHRKGNILTALSVFLSHRVFCTAPESHTARFKKTSLAPVGIDTDIFRRKSDIQKIRNSILFLGRISPVKRVDRFIAALSKLKKEGTPFRARIVGDPTPVDVDYDQRIKRMIKDLGVDSDISFEKGVSNTATVDLYNSCELYVNLTPSGSMDKTIFEAMASETLVLASNRALRGKVDDTLVLNDDADDIDVRLEALLALPDERKKALASASRAYVVEMHGLKKLAERLFGDIE